jgi:hypothetical protein
VPIPAAVPIRDALGLVRVLYAVRAAERETPREELEWRLTNFAPGERTEVEVLFEPDEDGTRVTVEHRAWSALRPDHPARHGQDAPAFLAGWGCGGPTSWARRAPTCRNDQPAPASKASGLAFASLASPACPPPVPASYAG